MPLPSLNHVLGRAAATFKRFPVTILDSIFGTACFFLFLQTEKGPGSNPEITVLEKLWITALLGLPLFFAIELYLERRGDRLLNPFDKEVREKRREQPSGRFLFYFVTLVLLGFFYMNYSRTNADAMQLFVLLLAAHLIVSFIAYLRHDETNGFWQLNKVMFLRILVSVLYTTVLLIGLLLALGAVDQLFGADIESESYAQIGVVLFGIFNTWFFLAGIPFSLGSQDQRTDYPKGLKIFTQFVLLPLVTIYLAILYPYGIKLLLEWNLPKGWVSNPVLWFSVVGILSFLLLYPIRNESGNEWIRKFSRYFFIALLPLLILPALGIYTRVRDYGITEERYFVIALVVWLLGISLYFVLSKKKDIRLIPISLAAIAIVSAIGPASAFTISRISQLNRLEFYLNKNGLLKKDRDVNVQASIPEKDYQEITSIGRYFSFDRKESILEDWLRQRVPQGIKVTRLSYDDNLATLLNFKSLSNNADQYEPINQPVTRKRVVSISDYDYYLPLSLSRDFDHSTDTVYTSAALTVVQSPFNREMVMTSGSDSLYIRYIDVVRELKIRRDSLMRAGVVESFEPTVVRTAGRMRVLIALDYLTFPLQLEDPPGTSSALPDYRMNYRGEGALFITIANP